jgi:hypothetical protein
MKNERVDCAVSVPSFKNRAPDSAYNDRFVIVPRSSKSFLSEQKFFDLEVHDIGANQLRICTDKAPSTDLVHQRLISGPSLAPIKRSSVI